MVQGKKINDDCYVNQTFTYMLVEGKWYGIRISSFTGESESVENIFTSKKEAQEVLKLLCEGLVTPITLRDVLTDYIDERDFISWHLR